MEWLVWLRAISALALIALLLLGLYWAVRFLAQGRILALGRGRLVSVVESTFLAQHASIHVVKMGERYFLVGAGSGQVSLISELPAEDVEPFIETQRQAITAQTARIGALFRRGR